MSELPSNAGPLYEKVKEYVLANIGNGQWQTDHRLPSENELVAMLGVSRMTVNRALRELTAAGILVRIQGSAPSSPRHDRSRHSSRSTTLPPRSLRAAMSIARM